MTVLFVYGTLQRGEPAHHKLGNAKYLGRAKTKAQYRLLDFGWYPALAEGGDTCVCGELYAVDDNQLSALDAYEEHPTVYRRTPTRLFDGREAETYLLVDTSHEARARGVIASGDWRMHRPRLRR